MGAGLRKIPTKETQGKKWVDEKPGGAHNSLRTQKKSRT